jgi:hypothetical protein
MTGGRRPGQSAATAGAGPGFGHGGSFSSGAVLPSAPSLPSRPEQAAAPCGAVCVGCGRIILRGGIRITQVVRGYTMETHAHKRCAGPILEALTR